MERAPGGARGLWIVPGPLAREQVVAALGRRLGVAGGLRVWCWDDLWRAVAAGRPDAPARLSEAALRAVLDEAIERAGRAGDLSAATGRVLDFPGFRARLRDRFAGWSRQDRRPSAPPPRDGQRTTADEWAIYRRYRAILADLGAEDPEGFAHRAAGHLNAAPPELSRPEAVVMLHPEAPSKAIRRAMEHFSDHASEVLVTLPYDPDPACAEAFGEAGRLRIQLLAEGFTEEVIPADPRRPAGLAGVEAALFRDGAGRRPPLDDASGLHFLGAPRGEGQGLLIARRVQKLLDAGNAHDDVLIVVRHWGEPAELILEALQSWGVPAAAAIGRPLTNEPAVSALRLAMSVPVEGWEASRLIRLLRNGQLRPSWEGAGDPLALATAATAVHDTRAFRGREAIRTALDRAIAAAEGEPDSYDTRRIKLRAERAREARTVLDGLIALYDQVARPGAWSDQVERLRRLAEGLGLGSAGEDDRRALEHVWGALDDQGAVREALGGGYESWTWAEFAGAVERLVAALPVPSREVPPGVVRLVTVEEAAGARARHVVLADLAEGTFPARAAVTEDPGGPEESDDEEHPPAADRRPSSAYAREMRRFLAIVGSAEKGLTLAYPTTDEKGQDLLGAGFLGEVQRLFAAGTLKSATVEHRRLDPILPADLARSPADARVRAVAVAAGRGDLKALKELARRPEHAGALEGTAAALEVLHRRLHDREFGPFDGRLGDEAAIRAIAEAFAPGRHVFSPSQLETLALCPFQFFLRYVLRLEPVIEQDELGDDATGRGSLIHQVLERLHTELRDVPAEAPATLSERVAEAIGRVIDATVSERVPAGSDVEATLREIEAGRLRRLGDRYVEQFARYAAGDGARSACRHFEVKFGHEDSDYQVFKLGQEHEAVHIQGMIDRIDEVPAGGRTLFRVIDYKSGSCPSRKEITGGLALQLPLYALAAERLEMAGPGAEPLDSGYWSLKTRGFKAALTMATLDGGEVLPASGWLRLREALEDYVVALVAQLRRGAFPIVPLKDDCMRLCDYATVCRVGQVREARKAWPGAPRLEAGS